MPNAYGYGGSIERLIRLRGAGAYGGRTTGTGAVGVDTPDAAGSVIMPVVLRAAVSIYY